MIREIHGEEICGVNIDKQTRCAHYYSKLDIIAVKFKCCGKWFPCFQCHAETETHAAQIWAANEFQTEAILCGACGRRLKIAEYFECGSICPKCAAKFNPNCALHYGLYFQVTSDE